MASFSFRTQESASSPANTYGAPAAVVPAIISNNFPGAAQAVGPGGTENRHPILYQALD